MNLEEGILTRRSIRKYQKNNRISKEDTEALLNMAMHAPSALNTQPWEFIVVDDQNVFNKIMAVHPYCSFLKDASLAIVVCGNLKEQHKDNYWMGDCVAATENLLLGAHARGLGGCWCGIYPTEERMQAFHKLFGLPEYVQPFSLVVVGYPAEEPKQPHDRFKKAKIHTNHW